MRKDEPAFGGVSLRCHARGAIAFRIRESRFSADQHEGTR